MTIEETYSSRPDLKDVPLENPDWELYMDGSSFMQDGKRMTGYAVTTKDEVMKAKALPTDVSSQKAELIELTRALELSKGKKAAKGTAEKGILAVISQKEIDLTGFTPKYDEKDHQSIKSLKAEIKENAPCILGIDYLRNGYFKGPKGHGWVFGIATVETEVAKQLNSLLGLSETPSAVGLLKVEEQRVSIATTIVHHRQYRTN
ncbi:hypothetical protein BTVI_40009 [Pitangus sulphuratus]|nr:hypothetical protein BTVI_40009 [Pitangus sulphuratus]